MTSRIERREIKKDKQSHEQSPPNNHWTIVLSNGNEEPKEPSELSSKTNKAKRIGKREES